jgi:asparagine synthase (glutamine-hydrolysing)
MCGIAGLFRLAGVDSRPIQAMTSLLAHRGPDGEKICEVPGPNGSPMAALGVRRLAIVDPEGGEQPVWDESETVLVAFNGEVYNHRRLRTELKGAGRSFRSACDSEVVANLVASAGLETALGRMQGMFSIAVVEPEARRCTLVRDRMGVKPLYWSQLEDGTLLWASEARSLLQHPDIRAREDRRALQALLLFEYIPTPWSAWAGIQKLEPGCMLIADSSGVRIQRWWTPPVPEAGGAGSLLRWSESLRGALSIATYQRMEADVEVGYLLSGGLDSSTIAALAARRAEDIFTFSVSVDAAGFDEAKEARAMAEALGARHKEVKLTPEDLPTILAEIGAHMDEPLADSSLIPTWKLMESVAQAGLKCVLSGDGADESLAGYPTCTAHQLAGLARPAKGVLSRLGPLLPTRFEGVSSDYMARRFVEGLDQPWPRRHQIWMGAWLPRELRELDSEVWGPIDSHAAQASQTDLPGRAMYLDQRLYLSDGILVKVDRASMAHGIEVRSPFLDHSIVELCASMSTGMKLQRGKTKRVLRRAVQDLLPRSVIDRKKKGFGAPVGPWLRGPCTGLLEGLPEAIEDLVSPDQTRQFIEEHRQGSVDHRRRLWSAIVLRAWREGPWSPSGQA